MVKILVCGSRDYEYSSYIETALDEYIRPTIVCGGASGADNLAFLYALDHGHFFVVHNADWGKYGKSAGPIRNKQMLDSHPDIYLVLAFYVELGPGTRNMIKQAKERGIEVQEHDCD